MKPERMLAAACAAGLLCLSATGAAAQQRYPDKPIRLIVPFGAGGGSDYVGRLVGVKLTEQMGQTVVVDNRPGAASLVGTEIAMRAAPDGHTLLLADSGYFATNSVDWVDNLHPQLVVLSVAAGDPDGLPSPEALDSVGGYPLLRTDRNGWIKVSTNGTEMRVEAERP